MAKPNTIIKVNDVPVGITLQWNDIKKRYVRRLTMWFDDVEDIPAELFEFKRSQSKDPEKRNKFVFSNLNYYTEDEPKGDSLVPINNSKIDEDTDLNVIKDFMVKKYQTAKPDTKYRVFINVNGQYLNVDSKIDNQPWIIFNNQDYPGDVELQKTNPRENKKIGIPLAHGKYPAYFISGTRLDVTLRSMSTSDHPDNYFYNVSLSTDTLSQKDLFRFSRPGVAPGEDFSVAHIERSIGKEKVETQTESTEDFDFDLDEL